MSITKDLVIRIKAEAGEFLAGLKLVAENSKQLETQLSGAAKVSGVAFAALTAVVGVSVARFAEFEKQFTNVVTLLDDSSFKTTTLKNGINDLKKGVLDLGAKTGQSFETLNAGLFTIISAGVPAEQAIQALTEATSLAAAGATTTAIAVDGLTSAMGAYGLTADKTRLIAEKFFTAQKSGKTNVEQLAGGFGLVAGQAATMGVKLDELLASVSAVTTGGIQTNAAYTGLKAALVNIAKPTDDARREALRLGVAFDGTALKSEGLAKFLDGITSSAGYNQESMNKLFGSAEAINFVMQLVNGSSDTFKDILKKLGDQAQLDADYNRALAASQATVDMALNKIKVSADAAIITLGEKFAPTVIAVADAVGSLVQWFRGLDDTTVTVMATIIKVATVLAATVFSFATLSLGIAKAITIGKDMVLLFETLGVAARVSAGGLAAFGAVATGGLTLILAFLPEILTELKAVMPWWKEFFGIKDKSSVDTLAANNEMIKKTQEAVAELIPQWRAAKGAQKDYLLSLIANGNEAIRVLQKQNAAMSGAKPGAPKPSASAPDPAEAARTAQKRVETQKRIALAREENTVLLAEQSDTNTTQVELMKKRYELEHAAKEAALELDNELRGQLLANIDIQNAMLLRKQQELNDQLAGAALELASASDAARSELLDKDIQALQASYQTKADMESAYQRRVIEIQRACDVQRLADTKKYGAAYAAINAVINSEEINAFAAGANELAKLQASKSKELQAIGKAAAVANIVIATAEGAMKAYAAFAWIPLIGPALGIAAAGAVIAYGAEQTGTVMGAQKGALVRGVGSGDRVPAALERGELVVPAKYTDQFLPVLAREKAKLDGDPVGGDNGGQRIDIRLLDRAEEFITVTQQQNATMGIK